MEEQEDKDTILNMRVKARVIEKLKALAKKESAKIGFVVKYTGLIRKIINDYITLHETELKDTQKVSLTISSDKGIKLTTKDLVNKHVK